MLVLLRLFLMMMVMRQMQKGVGFVRIKPIQCEKSAEARSDDDELFDPFIAVKVLDAETISGQH